MKPLHYVTAVFSLVATSVFAYQYGAATQNQRDHALLDNAAQQRIGAIYRTPKGDNWVLAHVYVPQCNGKRIVDTPERDEVDALSVYCTNGDPETYDELAEMAGNQ